MRNLKILSILIFFFTALQAQGSIALRGKDFSAQAANKTAHTYQGRELNLNRKFVKGRQAFNTQDVAKIVPLNLGATGNGDMVKEEIFKKTASSIFKSPMIQNSFLAKSMKKAQESTKLGMTIKAKQKKGQAVSASSKKSPADMVVVEQPTVHKFDINVEALKAQARLTYQGYVNSKVQYNHAKEAIEVSLDEKLSDNSKIALSHQSGKEGSLQMLNFQMNW